MTLYFDVTILKDFDGFIFVFIFPNKAGFSWIYTVANFFPSSSVNFHHSFYVFGVPVPFESSAKVTCLDGSIFVFSFEFLTCHARTSVIPSAYIAIAVGSPCVISSSIFNDLSL